MSTRNPLAILGFTGPAGSGKDTAGAYLIEHYGCRKVSFAGPIYDMLEVAGFGRPKTQAEKEAIIAELGVSWRHMAQTLGTEWGRRLVHDDLWVVSAKRSMLRDGGAIVLTDVRFENEALTIRALGGIVCHLQGRADAMSQVTAGHASETGIAFGSHDVLVDNSGSLQHLHEQLDNLALQVGLVRDTLTT